MTLSFIVTTFDVLPYLGRCLASLAACARPGDRVIVVDDGSDDGTAERLEALLAESGFAPGVALQPILLGANTIGGVGIAGNTGLHAALSDPACEAVFFVDGDDWLVPEGFRICRSAFEAKRPDILIANYAEYNDGEDSYRRPADTALWGQVPRLPAGDTEAARQLALKMIAVPWRKFYRADFLRAHGLRFPEGDFFFEDNPFHWEVCLKAETIGFFSRGLCLHRFNRPGQTMASTGLELTAFFTHYDSIRAMIRADRPDGDPGLEAAALTWLLNNMSWHVNRLEETAIGPYASRAARALAAAPDPAWQTVMAKFADQPIGPVAETLRRGDVTGAVTVLMQAAQAAALTALQARMEALEAAQEGLRQPLGQISGQLSALTEIQRFQALTALPGGPRPAAGQTDEDDR